MQNFQLAIAPQTDTPQGLLLPTGAVLTKARFGDGVGTPIVKYVADPTVTTTAVQWVLLLLDGIDIPEGAVFLSEHEDPSFDQGVTAYVVPDPTA
jgi:hypothetical protein